MSAAHAPRLAAAAARGPATHDCPGGCGAQVARSRFACRTCWYRLPADLRQPITANYRRQPMAHLQAMSDASRWYRNNPLPSPPAPLPPATCTSGDPAGCGCSDV